MSPRFHVAKNKEEAALAAAEFTLDRLSQALEDREKATLAVSGGSTPRLMFEHLATSRFDWHRVHIFCVDERCVPPDHADSNYRAVRQALLDLTGIGAGQIHRIEGELQRSGIQFARFNVDQPMDLALRSLLSLRARAT